MPKFSSATPGSTLSLNILTPEGVVASTDRVPTPHPPEDTPPVTPTTPIETWDCPELIVSSGDAVFFEGLSKPVVVVPESLAVQSFIASDVSRLGVLTADGQTPPVTAAEMRIYLEGNFSNPSELLDLVFGVSQRGDFDAGAYLIQFRQGLEFLNCILVNAGLMQVPLKLC